MKKVLFMAALFAATSVMFVGCKKKAAKENAEEAAPAQEQQAPAAQLDVEELPIELGEGE